MLWTSEIWTDYFIDVEVFAASSTLKELVVLTLTDQRGAGVKTQVACTLNKGACSFISPRLINGNTTDQKLYGRHFLHSSEQGVYMDGAYKKTLLLIGKSSPCGGSGFPLLLSEWSFTICLTTNKMC